MALKITRQRVALFTALCDGTPKTFRQIQAACGAGSATPRGDYIRVHQFVMGFVKQGILAQHKAPRHGESTFALTPLGVQTAARLLEAFGAKVRRMMEWDPVLFSRPLARLAPRGPGYPTTEPARESTREPAKGPTHEPAPKTFQGPGPSPLRGSTLSPAQSYTRDTMRLTETPITGVPPKEPETAPLGLRCPYCGVQRSHALVERALANQQKIWCDCGQNLTPLAWALFDRR